MFVSLSCEVELGRSRYVIFLIFNKLCSVRAWIKEVMLPHFLHVSGVHIMEKRYAIFLTSLSFEMMSRRNTEKL